MIASCFVYAVCAALCAVVAYIVTQPLTLNTCVFCVCACRLARCVLIASLCVLVDWLKVILGEEVAQYDGTFIVSDCSICVAFACRYTRGSLGHAHSSCCLLRLLRCVGAYKVTKGLHKKWGSERIWDTPITGASVCSSPLSIAPLTRCRARFGLSPCAVHCVCVPAQSMASLALPLVRR